MDFLRIYLEDKYYLIDKKKLHQESLKILAYFLTAEIGYISNQKTLDFYKEFIFIDKDMTFNLVTFYTRDNYIHMNYEDEDPSLDFIISPENLWDTILEWKKLTTISRSDIYLVNDNNHISLYSEDDYKIIIATDGTEQIIKKNKE